MYDTSEIIIFVALGLAFAAGVVVLAHWAKQSPLRFAAYGLIASAAIYIGFALRSDNAPTWAGIEMTGVAIFGSLAMLSMIVSPWFVVAGLALHPLWAIAFHYVGTGSAFTPGPFALADAGFDGALALASIFYILKGAKAKATVAAVAPAAAPARSKKERA